MLQIFRDIEESGEDLIVTDHNRPVLKIQPIKKNQTVDDLFADCQGKVNYQEDINAPTQEEWSIV